MGVLAPRSAHAWPSAQPPQEKNVDQFLISLVLTITLSKWSFHQEKSNIPPHFFIIFIWNLNIFVSKEPMQDFGTLRQHLLGFK